MRISYLPPCPAVQRQLAQGWCRNIMMLSRLILQAMLLATAVPCFLKSTISDGTLHSRSRIAGLMLSKDTVASSYSCRSVSAHSDSCALQVLLERRPIDNPATAAFQAI